MEKVNELINNQLEVIKNHFILIQSTNLETKKNAAFALKRAIATLIKTAPRPVSHAAANMGI